MAEQSAQDVVIQTQSVGQDMPVDESGTTYKPNSTGDGEGRMLEQTEQEQGVEKSRQSGSLERDGTIDGSTNTVAYETNAGLSANNRVDELHSAQTNQEPQHHAQDSSILDGSFGNGETGSNVGSDDAGYQNSTGIDTNPDSDNEANKSEGAGQGKDEVLRRERADSVKKVPAFKTVSVTKNFLAKSGVGQASVTKSAVDKGTKISRRYSIHWLTHTKVAPMSQSTLPVQQPNRPRLVAKLGRDARSLNAVPGIASGPDANRVWNRNKRRCFDHSRCISS